MKRSEVRRRKVSDDYARAVTAGTGCCCGDKTPKGAVAKFAGYTAKEVAALPDEAVENSFGCGNPLAMSKVRRGDVVLDLGSGAGIDLLIAARKVGKTGKVIGVDMTDAMIRKARKNAAAMGLANVEIRKGIIEDLPVESGSVDWVISNCVINLSPEKQRVFAEIARVLKPGGRMLVSDIVAENLPAGLARNRRLYSSCLAGAIGEKEYKAGLRKAGLGDVKVVDRVVYDESQIEALIGSELPDGGSKPCRSTGDSFARRWARKLSGKVASVRVAACRVQPRSLSSRP